RWPRDWSSDVCSSDLLAPVREDMPTFVAYPHIISDGSITPGQHASFLGKRHDPLLVLQDPNSANFNLPELTLPASLTVERLEQQIGRASCRERVESWG